MSNEIALFEISEYREGKLICWMKYESVLRLLLRIDIFVEMVNRSNIAYIIGLNKYSNSSKLELF